MPERRLFPEFRDQYAPTRYPFTDVSTLVASNNTTEIDPDLFLDASLYPIGASGFLYLSSIEVVSARDVTITISDQSRQPRAFAQFDPLFAPDVLRVTDGWGRPAGVLVSESVRLSRLSSWVPGVYDFSLMSTTFVPSCVIPTPEVGVRGLITEKGELFTKDALIVGDNGVVVSREGLDTIRVDIVGDPLFLRENCTEVERFTSPNFVQTINGCRPDSDGNFNLTVGDHQNEETIVRIYAEDGVLVFDAIGKTTV